MANVPARAYAVIAAAMFVSFASAIVVNPGTATWLAAGLAAVALTSVLYAYLEYEIERRDEEEAEKMLE